MNIFQERYDPVLAVDDGFAELTPVPFIAKSIEELLGRPLPDGANAAWIVTSLTPWFIRLDGDDFFFPNNIGQYVMVRLTNGDQLRRARITSGGPLFIQFFRGGCPGTTL